MKKSLSLVLALMLILSLVACGNQSATPSNSAGPVATEVKGVTIPAFSVTVNGVTVDQTAMAFYPMYSVQATSTNSAGTESTTTYVGFAMKDVFAAAKLTEAYVWLEAKADDGYAVTVTGEKVLADTTLLAMTKDGEPFGTSPWLAPCSSVTTGDYLKGCVSMLVNTTEGAPDSTVVTPEVSGSELALTGELPEIQDKTDKVEFADFYFIVNGKGIINSKLKDLHIYKITVTVADKSGALSESTYTGYKLADVLTVCGIQSPTSVELVTSDGNVTELDSKLIASEYTLVAIEKDEVVGESGTIWVAPCSETASKSYLKLVVGMNVK